MLHQTTRIDLICVTVVLTTMVDQVCFPVRMMKSIGDEVSSLFCNWDDCLGVEDCTFYFMRVVLVVGCMRCLPRYLWGNQSQHSELPLLVGGVGNTCLAV